jgi:hypothetical protein
MRHLGRLAIALVVLLASCHAAEDAGAPKSAQLAPKAPNRDEELDCQLSPERCQLVQAGISYLLQHANGDCRAVGASAWDRYNAPSGSGEGYKNGDPAMGGFMYGFMRVNTTSPSGYAPTDGYVYIQESAYSAGAGDPATMGSFLAHEEKHKDWADNPYHSMNVAYEYQRRCLNPQA